MEKTERSSLLYLDEERIFAPDILWLSVLLLVFACLFVCLVLFWSNWQKNIFYTTDTRALKFLNLFLKMSVLTQRFLPHPQAGRLWPVSVCPPQGALQPRLPPAFLVAIAHPHGQLVSPEHFSGYIAFAKVIEETKNFPQKHLKHYVYMVFYR